MRPFLRSDATRPGRHRNAGTPVIALSGSVLATAFAAGKGKIGRKMLFNSEGIGGSGDLMHRASLSLVADTGGRIGDVSIPNDANDPVRALFEY